MNIRLSVQEEDVIIQFGGLLLGISFGVVKSGQHVKSNDVVVDIDITVGVVADGKSHIGKIVEAAPGEEDSIVRALPIKLFSAVCTGNIDGETLNWSISGDTAGIRIVPSEDTMSAQLFIGASAVVGGNVVVTVSSLGGSLSQSQTVALESIVQFSL